MSGREMAEDDREDVMRSLLAVAGADRLH